MATWSYNPLNLAIPGMDKMRFELGDTAVEMGAVTCALCDEEYAAMLGQYPDWQRAKLACLRAIVMKLSYEVDTQADGLSYALSQRFPRWKTMLDEAEKKLSNLTAIPRIHGESIGKPYFYGDLHANPRRF